MILKINLLITSYLLHTIVTMIRYTNIVTIRVPKYLNTADLGHEHETWRVLATDTRMKLVDSVFQLFQSVFHYERVQ